MKSNPSTVFQCHPLSAGVRLQTLTLSGVLATQLLIAAAVNAAPAGETIVGGTGSVSRKGFTTRIEQTSSRLAINWESFDVGRYETVKFVQPSASALVLNRILDHNPSRIRGSIDANGNVLLVNPRGILFTETAAISAHGLVASGLDVSVDDFMNGNLNFKGLDGNAGAVVNKGVIQASSAALLGKTVHNAAEALIIAELVTLAAGDEALITFDADGMLGVKVTRDVVDNQLGLTDAVLNEGHIKGNDILLQASVSRDLFTNAVNNTGVVTAQGIDTSAGGIRLTGRGTVANAGNLGASGSVAVTADALINRGEISAGGAAADVTAIQIDTVELHNRGVIRSGRGSMTIALGRDGAYGQHIMGELTGDGDIAVHARGGSDGSDSLSFDAGGRYVLRGDGVVAARGVTITGADRIDTGGDGVVQGRDGVADAFAVTGSGNLQVDGVVFSNVTAVHGGAGGAIDSVAGAGRWQLNGQRSVIAEGMTFNEVEQVGSETMESWVIGRDQTTDVFAVTGHKMLSVDDMNFTGVVRAEGGNGSPADRVTGAGEWFLNGSGSVRAGGMVFAGIEQAGTAEVVATLHGRDHVAEAFVVRGDNELMVDDMVFTNITVVNAGTGSATDEVSGAAQLGLRGVKSIAAQGITFTDIEQVTGTEAGSSISAQDDVAEVFTVTGARALRVDGMVFSHIATVDAGRGDQPDRVTGATHWQLQGSHRVSAQDMQFSGIERVDGNGADITLTGRDHHADRFVITDSKKLLADDILFTNVGSVNAGGGSVEDQVSGAVYWTLTGERSVTAGGMIFNDVERVVGSGPASTLNGRDEVADSFKVTGSKALRADSIAFDNIALVQAGGGAVADQVTGSTGWLLQGNNSVSTEEITFSGVEQVKVTGNDGHLTASALSTETFVVAGNHRVTVAGMDITGVSTVVAQAADRVQDAGDLHYELHSPTEARVGSIRFQGAGLGNSQWGTGDSLSLSVDHQLGGKTVDSRGAQLIGSDNADNFTVTASNTVRLREVTFTNLSGVDARGGGDAVTGAEVWELHGHRSVQGQGVLFRNIEQVGSATGASRVKGRDEFAESFIVTSSGGMQVDGMNFRNITAVTAGGGAAADSVTGADEWQLNGSRSLIAGGISFTGVELAGDPDSAGIIRGRDGVAETFVLTGSQALTVDDIAFIQVSAVDGGSGSETDQVTGVTDWQLQGYQSVHAGGVTFTGIGQAGSTGLSNRITGQQNLGKTYAITGRQMLQVDGIHFDSVASVNAGSGSDQVRGASEWQLAGTQSVHAAGITFTGIDSAGSADITASLVGRRDIGDAFVVNGTREVSASGIGFTNIVSVDGGSGAGADRVSGASQWQLQGLHSVQAGGVLFTGIERADSGSDGTVQGANGVGEAFELRGEGELRVDGIDFSGIALVNAGSGAATDSVAGSAQWQLHGHQSLHARGVTLTGIERAGSADVAGHIHGRDGVADAFVITGNRELIADGIAFANVGGAAGGAGGVDRASAAVPLEWQLTGAQHQLTAAGMLLSGIEEAQQASDGIGFSQVRGSHQADHFALGGAAEITANGIRITGVDFVDGQGNHGGNDLLESGAVEVWQLAQERGTQLLHAGIRFTGLEEVRGAAGSSLLGTAGDDHFVVASGNHQAGLDQLIFSNISRVDGGGGEDTVIAGDGQRWQLTDAHGRLTSDGMTFINVDIATAPDAMVLGRAGVADTFNLSGTPRQLSAHGVRFTGVARVDGGAGTGDRVISHAPNEWQLIGGQHALQAADITFAGIENADFGAAVASSGTVRGTGRDEIFHVSGAQPNRLTVNGVTFSRIGSVDAGGGNNRVVSADAEQWALTGKAGELQVAGMNFRQVSAAGAKAGSAAVSALRGSPSDELFEIDAAQRTITAAGIRFDHLGSVDAAGGDDSVHNARPGHWRAGEQGDQWLPHRAETLIDSVWVRFANLEQVLGTGKYTGPSQGADYRLLDTQTVRVGGIRFTGVTQLEAGAGTDTLYGPDIAIEWSLDGTAGSAGTLGFNGFETLRAGAARDVFTFRSGVAGNVYTGDGSDSVYLNGGSVANLYLQGGDDQLFVNRDASAVLLLDGGTGTDVLTSALPDLTWRIASAVDELNYVGNGKGSDYAFTGFESLRNGPGGLRVSSALAAAFSVDRVQFKDSGINLDFTPGDIHFTNHHRGADALSGTVHGSRLAIRSAGGVDLSTRAEHLSVHSLNNRSIDISVREADDLMVGQIYAGSGGTISLTSMGLGALTAEARGLTHLTADTVHLGSEWQRWISIGEQLMPLRMEVGRTVNIGAFNYVEPEFVNGSPSVVATGNRLQSVTGSVASQGMKSAVQANVEQLVQVDPAIFTSVSPYSVHADAVNGAEFALVAGELVPTQGIVSASGEVDGDRASLTEEQ